MIRPVLFVPSSPRSSFFHPFFIRGGQRQGTNTLLLRLPLYPSSRALHSLRWKHMSKMRNECAAGEHVAGDTFRHIQQPDFFLFILDVVVSCCTRDV